MSEVKQKSISVDKCFWNFLKSETIFLKIYGNKQNKPKIMKNSKIRNKNETRSPIFVKRSLDPSIIFQNFKIKKSIFKPIKTKQITQKLFKIPKLIQKL